MRTKLAKADRLVAQIAGRQHGVVSVEQLLWAGLSRTGIKRRVQSGRLHRVNRGVYAVGHRNLSLEGHWMAAVLACGKQAVLGFVSAGALWRMVSLPTSPFPIHVVVPGDAGRAKRRGITIHRTSTLGPRDVTRRRNIPVTSPDRTRRDLGFGREPTRSHLERAFIRLAREAGLPKPEVNVRVDPYEVDFLWRDEHLIVEADSWTHHSDRTAFEADRRRDRELQRRGYSVLRFSYREVVDDPDAVAASLQAHLHAPTDPPTPRD